jgi:hypothetical protein
MSWLFSRALVEEYSPATCSAGAQSAQLNVMPTPHKFWRNDRTMDYSRLSRFGLTCAVLTADAGEALLTSFLEAFRARTSQGPAQVQALKDRAPASGKTWLESSVRYCQETSTWKTHQCLWAEDLHWSSASLPKWGMTRSGVLFQRQISERPISGTASGSSPGDRTRIWPTPVASMAKGSSLKALTRRSGADRSNDRLDHAVMALHGGHLNPTWVEWLMGWPSGWTDLKPLGMARFREWQRQHSGDCIPAFGEAMG